MKKMKASNSDEGSSGVMTASDGPASRTGEGSEDDDLESDSSSSSSSSEETKDLDQRTGK